MRVKGVFLPPRSRLRALFLLPKNVQRGLIPYLSLHPPSTLTLTPAVREHFSSHQRKGQKDRLTQPSRNEALLWGQHEAVLVPEAVPEGAGCSLGPGRMMATASSHGTQQTASTLLCCLQNTPARRP